MKGKSCMNPEENILEWLKKADEDFEFASSILPDTTFYAQVCFHLQQSAEKYLKAFIVKNKLKFKKIHDLTELLQICSEKESGFSLLFEDCNLLTDYYIDTRYPVHWPAAVTKEDALKALDSANKIKSFVEKLLKH